jgi:hypothetical protein
MKKNVGTIDRIARILIAAIVVVLALTNVISGLPAIILLAVSAVLVATSIIGICPLYLLFRLNSNPGLKPE